MQDPESNHLPPTARRGRGAATNATGRFEPHERTRVDDGWDQQEEGVLRTEVSIDSSRTILAKNTSPDLPFDRSINPYRGCEHGCIYCFARPSHAYLGLSPGLDFETRLFAKPQAAELLRKTLARRGYRPATIAMGTNTDPYQPIEKRLRIMRSVLEVLQAHHHPLAIVTKGTLITRDVDILAGMAADGLAHVGISLTTLDPKLSREMEPRAASPAHRLRVVETLAQAGIPVRAMIAPVIPGLTDHELEVLMQAAADAGAQAASYIVLRLPSEVSGLFQDWLHRLRPDRAAKVMARVREMHDGKDYDSAWGRRMRGHGVTADLMNNRFRLTLLRTGLRKTLPELRTDLFRVPTAQLDLF